MKFKNILIFTLLFAAFSCFEKEEDELIEEEQQNNINFGKWVDLPSDYTFTEIRTTDSGLYFSGFNSNADKVIISRCDAGNTTPNWINFVSSDVQSWRPERYENEAQNTFTVFYTTVSKHGFYTINTSTPSLQTNSPQSLNNASTVTQIITDHSTYANKWIIDGRKIRVNSPSGSWNLIKELPETPTVWEADPKDAVLWLGSATKFYRLTVNGSLTSYDLSSVNNTNYFNQYIRKIRFSDGDVFFNFQNKIIKVANNTAKVFYTSSSHSALFSIEFAVDPSYVYISDGIKKNIDLGTESKILPDASTSTSYDLLEKVITFQSSGSIETSNNAADQNLYVLKSDGKRLLIINKTL